jgi:hypothetical protein
VPISFYFLFLRLCKANVVTNPTTFPLPSAALPYLLPRDTELPPLLLTGILPTRATPLKFTWPIASPPSSPAPRLDLVQSPPFLRRICPHPEPPVTGAARARLRRRQLPPRGLQPTQVYRSTPRSTPMLVRVFDLRVRWSFAGNGDAPPRPPHLLVDGQVPLPPFECTPSCVLTESRRSCLACPPRWKAHRRREHHQSRPAGRRQGRAGTHLQLEFSSQGPQCKDTETPPPPSALLFHVMLLLSCKFHNKL